MPVSLQFTPSPCTPPQPINAGDLFSSPRWKNPLLPCWLVDGCWEWGVGIEAVGMKELSVRVKLNCMHLLAGWLAFDEWRWNVILCLRYSSPLAFILLTDWLTDWLTLAANASELMLYIQILSFALDGEEGEKEWREMEGKSLANDNVWQRLRQWLTSGRSLVFQFWFWFYEWWFWGRVFWPKSPGLGCTSPGSEERFYLELLCKWLLIKERDLRIKVDNF